jgi:hypothetical protein
VKGVAVRPGEWFGIIFGMPKPDQNELLRMALIGYEVEREKIDEKMSEIRSLISGGTTKTAAEEAAPVRKRRRMSKEARARISAATKARWAAFRREKATAAKRTKKRPKLTAAERLKISGGQAKWKKNEVPF